MSNDISVYVGDVNEILNAIQSDEVIELAGEEPYGTDYFGRDIADLEGLPGLKSPEREFIRLLSGIHLGVHLEYERSGLAEQHAVTCSLTYDQLKPIWDSIRAIDLKDFCRRYNGSFSDHFSDYGVLDYLTSYFKIIRKAVKNKSGILARLWV